MNEDVSDYLFDDYDKGPLSDTYDDDQSQQEVIKGDQGELSVVKSVSL